MKSFYNRMLKALPRPLTPTSRVLVLLGALLVVGSLFVPLWHMTFVAQQYPEGLGPTLDEVREAVQHWAPLEKVAFDCCGADGFEVSTGNIVIAGMETHVCVYQTARSLVSRGHTVHVVSDAVVSRLPENREVGLELMRHAGAIVTSTEAVLFDLLKGSDAPEFKAISKLVR